MNALDKMNFGRNKGFQIGMVYLYDPGYLDWALAETDHFFLTDLEYLERFKPHFNAKTGYMYENVSLDDTNFFLDYFSFTELLYLGEYDFKFSPKAKQENKKKMSRFWEAPFKPSWADLRPEDQVYFLQLFHHPITNCEFDFIYMGQRRTERGYPYYLITFDNSKAIVGSLPHCANCKIAFLKDPEMDLSDIFSKLAEGSTCRIAFDNDNCFIFKL